MLTSNPSIATTSLTMVEWQEKHQQLKIEKFCQYVNDRDQMSWELRAILEDIAKALSKPSPFQRKILDGDLPEVQQLILKYGDKQYNRPENVCLTLFSNNFAIFRYFGLLQYECNKLAEFLCAVAGNCEEALKNFKQTPYYKEFLTDDLTAKMVIVYNRDLLWKEIMQYHEKPFSFLVLRELIYKFQVEPEYITPSIIEVMMSILMTGCDFAEE